MTGNEEKGIILVTLNFLEAIALQKKMLIFLFYVVVIYRLFQQVWILKRLENYMSKYVPSMYKFWQYFDTLGAVIILLK